MKKAITLKESLISLINEKKPTIFILNKEYKSIEYYLDISDKNLNLLHCYYFNKEKNTISVSFYLNDYEMKKARNII